VALHRHLGEQLLPAHQAAMQGGVGDRDTHPRPEVAQAVGYGPRGRAEDQTIELAGFVVVRVRVMHPGRRDAWFAPVVSSAVR
jgi:hypothetical protein